MQYFFSWGIVYSYSLFIIGISVIPFSATLSPFSFFDKLVHMAIYAVLACLVLNTVTFQKKSRPFLFSFFYVFGLGLALECIQFFLPWRSFELADLAFNLLGTGLGFLFRLRRLQTS